MAHIRHSTALGGLDPPFQYKNIGMKSIGLDPPLLLQSVYLLHVMTTMYYVVTSVMLTWMYFCANVSQINPVRHSI